MTATDHRTRDAELAVSLVVLVFALGAWFYNGWGWNQTARYDPIWAFVEPGPNRWTVRIDDFVTDPVAGLNTGDWARNADHGPHYYSNKAPGTTFLGIPFYFALYHVERVLGVAPTEIGPVLVNAYLIHLWVTVLPVALSAAFFFALLRRLGRHPHEAYALTVLLYCGTLLWPFSTMLWGHTTAAALVVGSLWCLVAGGAGRAVAAGFLAGAAVLTDYAAMPFAGSLVLAALALPERRRDAPAVVLGGLGPLLVFLAYQGVLFGSPLTLASSYSPAEMIGDSDFLGLFQAPDWSAIWGLTFSPVRGLFFFMPALALGLLTLRARVPDDHRWLVWLAAGNVAAVFLMNLSFNAWQGGVTTGARYQIVALPFWVLLVALLPRGRRLTAALVALGAVSILNMGVIAATSPMAPDGLRGSPLLFVWAKLSGVVQVDLGLAAAPEPGGPLSRGSLHIYPSILLRDWAISLTDPRIARWGSFNLGERLLGLRGIWSLLPIAAFAAGSTAWGLWLARRASPGEADR